MGVNKEVGLKSVWPGHVQKRLEVKPMLMLVVVVRVIARLPQACFVRRQQILAVRVIVAPTLAEHQ